MKKTMTVAVDGVMQERQIAECRIIPARQPLRGVAQKGPTFKDIPRLLPGERLHEPSGAMYITSK